jgi:hypothetical protein
LTTCANIHTIQIYDVKISSRGEIQCPTGPSYTVNGTKYIVDDGKGNAQTAFEGVDISGDGLTVGLGAESKDSLAIVIPNKFNPV